MEFNADILIPKLKEHVELANQSKFQLIDFDEETSILKNTVGETVLEASETLKYSISKLESEILDSRNLQIEYERVLGEIEKFQKITDDLLKRLLNLRYKAASTYLFWKSEYEKALVWLQQAIESYNHAENEFNKSLHEHKQAQENLRRRINQQDDDSGIIGSMIDSGRIRKARNRVRIAKEKLDYWTKEKADAHADLQRAKEKVRCTNQAVIYSTSAVEKANKARQTGEQISEIQEKTLQISTQTKTFFKEIVYKLNTKRDIVEIMRDYHRKVSDNKDYLDSSISILQNAIETSVSLLISANDETEFRIKKLVEFSQ